MIEITLVVLLLVMLLLLQLALQLQLLLLFLPLLLLFRHRCPSVCPLYFNRSLRLSVLYLGTSRSGGDAGLGSYPSLHARRRCGGNFPVRPHR
jgi:hypothetical protein